MRLFLVALLVLVAANAHAASPDAGGAGGAGGAPAGLGDEAAGLGGEAPSREDDWDDDEGCGGMFPVYCSTLPGLPAGSGGAWLAFGALVLLRRHLRAGGQR